MTDQGSEIHEFPSQKPSKSIKNRSLERGPKKSKKILKKVTLGIAVRSRDRGPKINQNGIQKT
jgi:hypothetical protein